MTRLYKLWAHELRKEKHERITSGFVQLGHDVEAIIGSSSASVRSDVFQLDISCLSARLFFNFAVVPGQTSIKYPNFGNAYR